jgi:hypothetical protein
MAQPLISVRQLDANHDPLWGNGQNNFVNDIEAVAQKIQTSLLLFLGEWWLNLNNGLPLFQSILASNNGKKADAISLLIQEVIIGVPFVTGISNVVTTFTTNRKFTFTCLVETQFGQIAIQFQPGASAVLPT